MIYNECKWEREHNNTNMNVNIYEYECKYIRIDVCMLLNMIRVICEIS